MAAARRLGGRQLIGKFCVQGWSGRVLGCCALRKWVRDEELKWHYDVRPQESLIVAIHRSDCGLEPGLDLALGSRGEARIEVEDWGEVVVDSDCLWYIALEAWLLGRPLLRLGEGLVARVRFSLGVQSGPAAPYSRLSSSTDCCTCGRSGRPVSSNMETLS